MLEFRWRCAAQLQSQSQRSAKWQPQSFTSHRSLVNCFVLISAVLFGPTCCPHHSLQMHGCCSAPMCIAHAVCDAHVCCASVATAILHEADACGCNRGCGIIGTLHLTCISFRRLMRRSSESSQAIPYGLRSISISHRSSCAQPLNHVRLFGRAESAESHRPVNAHAFV